MVVDFFFFLMNNITNGFLFNMENTKRYNLTKLLKQEE